MTIITSKSNPEKKERNKQIYDAKMSGMSYAQIAYNTELNPTQMSQQRIQKIVKMYHKKYVANKEVTKVE